MEQNNKIYIIDHNIRTIEEIIEQITLQITLQEPLYIEILNVDSLENCKTYEAALQEKYRLFNHSRTSGLADYKINVEFVRKDIFKTNFFLFCVCNDDEFLTMYKGSTNVENIEDLESVRFELSDLKDNLEKIEQFLPIFVYAYSSEQLQMAHYYDLFKLTYLGSSSSIGDLLYMADKKQLTKCAHTNKKSLLKS